jgi:MFS family permease
LASACALLWAGRLIDRKPLAVFSAAVLIVLAAAMIGLTLVSGWLGISLAFFALRFFGQGLSTHAAITAMGRYFSAERGRAVSIATLGHVTGEATLPFLAVALLTLMPWRGVWLCGAIALIALALPAMLKLLAIARSRNYEFASKHGVTAHASPRRQPSSFAQPHDFNLSQVLRDPGLYLRLPVLIAPSFIVTGLIFHQAYIGGQKGWSLNILASGLALYAGGALAMTVLAGPLVDRLSARRLVPFCLGPLALSCAVLATSTGTVAAVAFFSLLGFGSGLTAIMLGTIWAELYGVTHLGAIRAFGTSTMVFSSGLAPSVMGFMIDWPVTIDSIALGCILYCFIAAAIATFAREPAVRTFE